MALLDQSLLIALKGYAWLPDVRRRTNGRPVPMRVMGQRAIAIGGPEAARFFYADGNLQRHTALPHPVVSTLFGQAPCTRSTARRTGTARRCSSTC
jgi:fatty-acid peroxygenase